MAIEVGSAYVSILPSARGFSSKLRAALATEMRGTGEATGGDFGKDFGESASKSIRNPVVAGAKRAAAAAANEGEAAGRGFGQKMAGSVKGSMGGITTMMKAGLAGLALGGATAFFKGMAEDAQESALIMKRTENVIKTTGGAAKITAAQVGDLATALSNKTGADDEAIQSGANLLLTFSRVRNEAGAGNDVFNRTTELALDMSKAMGTDMSAATKILGKSLDDPVRGLTQLRRSGVSFTEQQQAQVKAMVASGDTLGAQKILLDEVGKKYGGAAAAMATPTERLQTTLGNLREKIGAAVLPAFDKFATFVADTVIPGIERLWGMFQTNLLPVLQQLWEKFRANVLPAFTDLWNILTTKVVPAIQGVVHWVIENRTWLLGLLTVVGSMVAAWKLYQGTLLVFNGVMKAVTVFTRLQTAAQAIMNAVMAANPIGLIVLLLVGLVAGLVYAWNNSETFRNVVTGVWEGIKSVIGTVWNWLGRVFNNLKTWFTVTLPNAVNTVREKIVGAFDAIKSGLGTAWDWVKKNVFDRFVGAFNFVIGKAGDFAKNIAKAFRGVARGVHTAVNWLLDKALGPLVNAWNNIADAIGMGDKKMSTPQLPSLPEGWASGGWTGPGAKYQPAGVVHADEYVLRKEATNKLRQTIGLSGLDHMNRTGEMPGYAKGGMVYQKMQSWLRGALPWARVSSSYRPGAITSSGRRSNHSMGRALDLVPSGKGTMMGIFNFLASKFPNAAELIYTPAGRRQIKNGRNTVYGGQVAADHHDHVHWAQALFNGAASGGSPLDLISSLLPPGVAAAISMAQIGYKALLGKLNTASPSTKGFNALGAKKTDMIGTAVRGKIAELEASMDAGPGDHSSASAADFKAGGGVERWRSTVLKALGILGLPSSLAGTTLRRMQQESGGNPRAINNWDSNARRGTPSMGLMQTILPTYRANAHPLYNKGPYDPLSNILASMRYALRTYGSLPRAYDRKGGYASGGLVVPELFDNGGILSPGLTLVSNQTGRPETVRTFEQEQAVQRNLSGGDTINIHTVPFNAVPELVEALDYALTRQRGRGRYVGARNA